MRESKRLGAIERGRGSEGGRGRNGVHSPGLIITHVGALLFTGSCLVGGCCHWWAFVFIGGHLFSLVGICFHWWGVVFIGGHLFLLLGGHLHPWAFIVVGWPWLLLVWCGGAGPHGHLWCSWVVVVVHHSYLFMMGGCCLLLNSCHIAIGNVAPASHVKKGGGGVGLWDSPA